MSKLFLALFLALTPTAFASIWYVDGVNGNDTNDCKTRTTACKTIGHAISLASSGDTIGVGPATYTENLTIGLGLKVIGARASTTIIDGGAVNTVVTVSGTASVVLSKLTIRNGSATSGGGIANQGILTINDTIVSGNHAGGGSIFGPCGGGGIYNLGTLTISKSTINSNSAYWGAGICNRANTATINDTTISGNKAFTGFDSTLSSEGGGIYNAGTLILTNSTLSGNSAVNGGLPCYIPYGGGIYQHGGILRINNSTLSGNYSLGCPPFEYGGGIFGNATLQNTIVANSTSGGNCYGTLTSNGYNLSSDSTCSFSGSGDLNNTDPQLGTLGNYGGPTQTMPLLTGSPAIDAGNPNGCTDGSGNLLKTDQRGAPRHDKEDTSGCDMGAYERQSD